MIRLRLYDDVGREVHPGIRQLLEPSQQRLPDELEASVLAAGAAWDRGNEKLAAAKLAQAVQLAEQLRYL